MKAVILKDIGSVDQLAIENIAIPQIKPNEILIKTKAFSINPIEVKTRKGNIFSQPLLQSKPSILGWDASGVVEKVGKEITNFSVGDRVFGVIGFPKFGKTYAEYIVAQETDLCKIPINISFEEAAVSTIGALTAYQALKHTAGLSSKKRVLIHAASGGVGHFGVQIAHHLGAEVYATASAQKEDFVKSLGADHFINYQTTQFEDITQNMDVVFDLIGGNYIDRSLKTLKKGGIIVSIPSVSNENVEAKAQQAGLKGARFMMQHSQEDLQQIAQLLANEFLKPHIAHQFSIDEIRAAHTALERGHITGKVVVTVP